MWVDGEGRGKQPRNPLMPTSRTRSIAIAYRQALNVSAGLPIPAVLSAESQLEQMERLVAKCDELIGKGHDPEVAARIVTAASAAHRVIALLRQQAEAGKGDKPLANLSDAELEQKRLRLVKELGAK